MKLKNPERIAIALFFMAIMFKVMHWPMAGVVMVVAVASVGPAMVYSLSQKKDKNIADYARAIFIISASTYILFRFMHWPNAGVLMMISLLSGAFWAVAYMTLPEKEELENGRKHKSSPLVYGAGTALVVVGALFKIMHWPYGLTLLLTGLIVLGLWFLADLMGIVNKEDSDLD